MGRVRLAVQVGEAHKPLDQVGLVLQGKVLQGELLVLMVVLVEVERGLLAQVGQVELVVLVQQALFLVLR